MENTETTVSKTSTTISVELSSEQYAFLTEWQKTHEKELGIEVPVGSMVRKAVDIAMKSERAKKDERPARTGGGDRGDRPSRPFGDRPPFKPGMRKPFGDRDRSDGPRRDAPRFGGMGMRAKKSF